MSMKWHKSTCPFCGLGCGVEVGVDHGRVVKVRGLRGHPVNNGDICRLPANYPLIISHEDRLKRPMIRRGGELAPVSWEEAIARVAGRLQGVVAEHGHGAVALSR